MHDFLVQIHYNAWILPALLLLPLAGALFCDLIHLDYFRLLLSRLSFLGLLSCKPLEYTRRYLPCGRQQRIDCGGKRLPRPIVVKLRAAK